MQLTPWRLVVAGCFLGFCITVDAQIYKWTDENGKVHYSDKKIAPTAQAQDLDIGAMPEAKAVTSLTPSPYAGVSPARYIVLHAPDLTASSSVQSLPKMVNFYFGGDCVSPTSLSYQEFTRRYRDGLPESDKLNRTLYDELKLHAYRVVSALPSVPKKDLDSNPPVQLRVDFVEIKINACAPELRKPTQSANLDNFRYGSFNKSSVWMKLHWSLTDINNDVTLMTASTEGAANDVDGQDGVIKNVFMEAYLQAVRNFIANPGLEKHVTVTTVTEIKVKAPPAPPAPAKPQEKSLLSGLANTLGMNAVKKSNVARALSLVSPLRVSVAEYYASRDEWPGSFAQMGLDPMHLREPGSIDSVELRLGGVIHVNLSIAEFGAGQFLQLIPRFTMGHTQMEWDCRTNLDQSYWVGTCVGI